MNTNEEIKSLLEKCKNANEACRRSSPIASLDLDVAWNLIQRYEGLLRNIPEDDCKIIGETFYNLLRVAPENNLSLLKVFSTLGYFFLSRSLQKEKAIDLLIMRIHLLNLGARTFYPVVAEATNVPSPKYVNYNDLDNLPTSMKYILNMELTDFDDLKNTNLTNDLISRKEWLYSQTKRDFFERFENNTNIIEQGKAIHKTVLSYIGSRYKLN